MVNLQVNVLFLSEVGRNGRLVVAARAARTFGYGCTSVLLAELLAQDGDAPWQTGLLLAAASAGSVVAGLALGLFADTWGRRRTLIACGCLMALAGVVFALSESYPLLVAAAFVGTISPSTNDNSPFSGVEQAILAQTCRPSRHTRVFTCYNVVASAAGAAGGLAAAVLGTQRWVSAADAAFALYAVLAACTVMLFLRLSADVEAPPRDAAPEPTAGREPTIDPEPTAVPERTAGLEPTAGSEHNAGGEPTGGPEDHHRPVPWSVRRLAGLFALDAFSGGLAVQAVLAWWFARHYGATTAQLGLVFSAANLLPALAQSAAPLLVARRGLLTAMLLPHAVANLLLAGIPFAPTLGGAVALLLARQVFSKIDVPARQAFTAAVVAPAHRTTAASVTGVARSVAVSVSPMVATLLLSGPLFVVGAPLLLGAALGIGYDITVWRTYRGTPLTSG
ncbi:MFS transporter [Sphaerisporangium fuscum]|uniref:MFS transporter n=1 Tax=Sphaerisporangium fuscum TaxID=2835868 RepID=UPI001BDD4F02|nr:MFS transporter [Sphaerisporangium fuscum]